MKTLLWLDDVRNPFVSDWLLQFSPEYHYEKGKGTHEVVWVKNYTEFVEWITENGLPTEIGFDHDLEPDQYDFDPTELMKGNTKSVKEYGKTGMDAAKWLVDYCIDNDVDVPEYFIQSANPVGTKNIKSLLENYKKHRNG